MKPTMKDHLWAFTYSFNQEVENADLFLLKFAEQFYSFEVISPEEFLKKDFLVLGTKVKVQKVNETQVRFTVFRSFERKTAVIIAVICALAGVVKSFQKEGRDVMLFIAPIIFWLVSAFVPMTAPRSLLKRQIRDAEKAASKQ